ncbi:MAG TPA: hypothetical protein VG538_12065 [Vicinamibacterales bacterium]|nr:hypothetical protein [Vicinamibacterales bacterium]
MAAGVGAPRICIGRDVALVAERQDGVEIEGRPRLRPGHVIEITRADPAAPSGGRRATVASWRVWRLGANGLIYRGFCEWA